MPDFGFAVSVGPRLADDWQTIVDNWSVNLPHQCDEWVVADGDKAEAIQQLRAFIGQAEQALIELQELEACPHEWEETGQESTHNGGTTRQIRCRICEWHQSPVVDRSTAQPWFAEQYYGKEPADA